MQKDLTTLKDQLASSRDQNDRSATTITELHEQLDNSAKRIDELKAKGMSSEEYVKMSKENEMLRGIVMRQLKDQARRASIKQLLVEELTRLDVQSSALNAQLEELGNRPYHSRTTNAPCSRTRSSPSRTRPAPDSMARDDHDVPLARTGCVRRQRCHRPGRNGPWRADRRRAARRQ